MGNADDRIIKFLREATPGLGYIEHLKHPPLQVLEDYLHGKLGLNERSWISAHITTCERCSATIEALRRGEAYQIHPTDEELLAYVYHQLEGDVIQIIERHLRSCEPCARRVEELRRERDEAFEGFVAAYSQEIDPFGVAFNRSTSSFTRSKGPFSRLRRWLALTPSAQGRRLYRYVLAYAAAGIAIFASLGVLLALSGQQMISLEGTETARQAAVRMAHIRAGINAAKWLAVAWGVGGVGLFLRWRRSTKSKKEG